MEVIENYDNKIRPEKKIRYITQHKLHQKLLKLRKEKFFTIEGKKASSEDENFVEEDIQGYK